jgi:hypothetical protein
MTSVTAPRPFGPIDTVLVVTFLLGLYLNVSLQITPTIPLTCAPSGFAGLALLWRRRDQIDPVHLGGLLMIVALYLGSILSASNYEFLGKRFTGLLQLTYSLVICYAFFATLVGGDRAQIARILLCFCVAIAVGCALEKYAGLSVASDWVRERIYDRGILYDADRRDEILYGHVRPKLFTSEPAAVTFTYTHFCFAWLVISRWRGKLALYGLLMAAGLFLMPGPTLLLMVMLLVPYLLFASGQEERPASGGIGMPRLVKGLALSLTLVIAGVVAGTSLFAERIEEFLGGADASTFYRVVGPMLVAFDVFHRHPWAGIGLTAEQSIENEVLTVFMNSPGFSSEWRIGKISEVLTNYFWLHWIYLGLVWGATIVVALCVWLRRLGVPSLLFCWSVWIILGQAGGAYVGPKAWSVMFVAAAGIVLSRRGPALASMSGQDRVLVPQVGLNRRGVRA